MSLDHLRSWVASAVAESFDVEADESERLAEAAIQSAPGSSAPIRAGEIVGLCRASRRLGWVQEWWSTDAGQRAFATLATCPDDAWTALNELCAAPAADALDPNWPAEKAFRLVDRPEGVVPGDEFVVGNGEGSRYLMRVVERDGQVGTEMSKALGAPLDSYWHQAIVEAERLARRSGD